MRTWITMRWLRVPEPRELSIAFSVVYLVALATGMVTLVYPPLSLSNEASPAAVSSVGGLLIAGALIGMVGGAVSNSKLEYIGLALQSWSVGLYGWVIVVLQLQTEGSRLTQIGVIVLALVGCYVVRWLLIWRREHEIKKQIKTPGV